MTFVSTRWNAATRTPNPVWNLDAVGGYDLSGVLLQSNGTTSFGQVLSGTCLGEVTATPGRYRPCTLGTGTTAGSLNTIVIGVAAQKFFIGDVVTLYDISVGTTLATGRNVTAVAATTVTFDGAAVALAIGDEIRGEDGSETPSGILLDSVTTVNLSPDPDGALSEGDQPITFLVEGIVDESEMPNIDPAEKTSIAASSSLSIIFR